MRRFSPAVGLIALLLFAAPVLAAPPANDDFAAATVIGDISGPYQDTVDTTDATAAADDPLSSCDESATAHTVWWEYTPAADLNIYATITGSWLLTAYTGERGALIEVGCTYEYWPEDTGGNRLVLQVTAGVTYYFMASGCEWCGGETTLTVGEAPEPLVVDLEFVSARFLPDGDALVKFSVACNRETWGFLWGSLSQDVGRVATVQGWVETEVLCPAEPEMISVAYETNSGKFKGGAAVLYAGIQVDDGFSSAFDNVSETVRLRR